MISTVSNHGWSGCDDITMKTQWFGSNDLAMTKTALIQQWFHECKSSSSLSSLIISKSSPNHRWLVMTCLLGSFLEKWTTPTEPPERLIWLQKVHISAATQWLLPRPDPAPHSAVQKPALQLRRTQFKLIYTSRTERSHRVSRRFAVELLPNIVLTGDRLRLSANP